MAIFVGSWREGGSGLRLGGGTYRASQDAPIRGRGIQWQRDVSRSTTESSKPWTRELADSRSSRRRTGRSISASTGELYLTPTSSSSIGFWISISEMSRRGSCGDCSIGSSPRGAGPWRPGWAVTSPRPSRRTWPFAQPGSRRTIGPCSEREGTSPNRAVSATSEAPRG